MGEVRAGESRMMARVVWAMSHGIAVLRFETDYSAEGAGTRFLQFAARILREGLGVSDVSPRGVLPTVKPGPSDG